MHGGPWPDSSSGDFVSLFAAVPSFIQYFYGMIEAVVMYEETNQEKLAVKCLLADVNHMNSSVLIDTVMPDNGFSKEGCQSEHMLLSIHQFCPPHISCKMATDEQVGKSATRSGLIDDMLQATKVTAAETQALADEHRSHESLPQECDRWIPVMLTDYLMQCFHEPAVEAKETTPIRARQQATDGMGTVYRGLDADLRAALPRIQVKLYLRWISVISLGLAWNL
ncbi:hypothetical protein MUK42_27967 [Musa troglodytarum]|uniref:Uncharacterized protein n=1 Tax=Musa troglodytarum TaxID=320322 RepID=A0A9E7F9W3_9LILI|nr:hypothetical protein MUK42_27967 [Musa troglodytarum]